MYEKITIVLACITLAALVHISVFHFLQIEQKSKTMECIFWAFLFVALVLMVVLPDNFIVKNVRYTKGLKISAIIFAIFLYLLLFNTYAGLYFLIDRSISCRILMELDRAPGEGLTKEELCQYYNGDMIVERRLEHLVYRDLVKLENGKYINNTKAHLIAKTFTFIKKFLNMTRGG